MEELDVEKVEEILDDDIKIELKNFLIKEEVFNPRDIMFDLDEDGEVVVTTIHPPSIDDNGEEVIRIDNDFDYHAYIKREE